jgi:hypothetical protein
MKGKCNVFLVKFFDNYEIIIIIIEQQKNIQNLWFSGLFHHFLETKFKISAIVRPTYYIVGC